MKTIKTANTSELLTRLSFAADYIRKVGESGLFPLHPYNWTIHLQATSFLYSYTSQSGRVSFAETAERCFTPLLDSMFEHNDNLILIRDEKANPTWNSLAAICCFKSNKVEQGRKLIHAVRDVINGKKSILTRSESHKAYPALALLWAQESEDVVLEICQNILSGAIAIDAADAWLLRITNQDRYRFRIQAMKDRFGMISIASMNSLFAGIAQQVYVANNDFHPDIFKLQQELQIIDDSNLQGAFKHNNRSSTTRLDYVVQNALSFMQQTRISNTELDCCL